MQWELLVESGQHAGKRIPVATRFVIGRDDACDLRPVSAQVSRQHCVLLPQVAHLFVTACHTTNGTFVNDRRIGPEIPVELFPGDRLSVGPLRFVIASFLRTPEVPDELSVAEMLLEMDRLEQQAEKEATLEGTEPQGTTPGEATPAEGTRTRGQTNRSSSSLAAESVLRTCLGSASATPTRH